MVFSSEIQASFWVILNAVQGMDLPFPDSLYFIDVVFVKSAFYERYFCFCFSIETKYKY